MANELFQKKGKKKFCGLLKMAHYLKISFYIWTIIYDSKYFPQRVAQLD